MSEQLWQNLYGVRLQFEQERSSGPLPASKAAISALPRVVVAEPNTDCCAICLCDYEVGCEAREMGCNHYFHSGCIERWLGLHATCPVCRFEMPEEEVETSAELGASRWVGEGEPFGGRDPVELGWRPARPVRGLSNVFAHIPSLVL